jgi:translation initiation factor IF-2
MAKKEQNKTENNLQSRPPIVVILGHVDHGKTSILDYIRNSKVVEKESGGITQHIGAYQVEHQNKLITFLDTPGHEAFSAMRSRGAKVADIAVLVVSAEDGVKPQTKEAINHVLHLSLPLIVAINKMDKPAALPEKVKKELAENNVLVESLGGKIPAVLVSAKTGLNINELLEMILLIAEMEDLKSDYSENAHGVVIESRLDPQRGPTATLLVQDGILRTKNIIATESAFGLIKSMENFLVRPIDETPPSSPVLITGLDKVPPVGEEWQVMNSQEEAKNKAKIKGEAERHKRETAQILDVSPDQKVFNLILKADVSGSLEAIYEALKSIPQQEVILRVIKSEVGDITENDVKLADSAKARIYGFRVKSRKSANILAQRQNVKITLSPIIYELIQATRQDASRLLAPQINRQNLGRLRILATFKNDGKKQIVGGRVTLGKIEKGSPADIFRNEEKIGVGRIIQLQIDKKDAQEATKDRECGIMFESEIQIERNDILEAYLEERVKRDL